jgi:hypothetical protein
VNDVEDDLTILRRKLIGLKVAAIGVTTPNPHGDKRRLFLWGVGDGS